MFNLISNSTLPLTSYRMRVVFTYLWPKTLHQHSVICESAWAKYLVIGQLVQDLDHPLLDKSSLIVLIRIYEVQVPR